MNNNAWDTYSNAFDRFNLWLVWLWREEWYGPPVIITVCVIAVIGWVIAHREIPTSTQSQGRSSKPDPW